MTTNTCPPICPADGYLLGYSIRWHRRRYGRQTYTWVDAKRDGEGNPWVSLGDPWPCMSPKRAEVHAAALAVLWPS